MNTNQANPYAAVQYAAMAQDQVVEAGLGVCLEGAVSNLNQAITAATEILARIEGGGLGQNTAKEGPRVTGISGAVRETEEKSAILIGLLMTISNRL